MGPEERDQRRVTFDRIAAEYDQWRPGYPDALVDDVIAWSGIPAGGRILEIGSGTGKATAQFARHGYAMLCVELGANMAAVAQHNLTAYPQVEFWVGPFEEWPVEAGAFDLAISAQAFHWLDAQVALPRIADALKPGGAIALFWNNQVEDEAPEGFSAQAQAVYARDAPQLVGLPTSQASEGAVRDWVIAEADRSGRFEPVEIRRYHWANSYSAAQFAALQSTHSNHQLLDPQQRQRLLDGLAELIDSRFGGQVEIPLVTSLYLAHLKSAPDPA